MTKDKIQVISMLNPGLATLGNQRYIIPNMIKVDKKADFISALVNTMSMNKPLMDHKFSIIEIDNTCDTINILKNLN